MVEEDKLVVYDPVFNCFSPAVEVWLSPAWGMAIEATHNEMVGDFKRDASKLRLCVGWAVAICKSIIQWVAAFD